MRQGKQWIWLLLIILISSACSKQTAQPDITPIPAEDAAIARFIASAPAKPQGKATATRPAQSGLLPMTGLPLPAVEPLNVTGDLLIAGSATLAPVTRAVYTRFVQEGYNGTIKIQELSTGAEFQSYCAGESDIAMALRPMLQAELDSCLKHDRAPIALQIGFSPIAIVVNKANTYVTDITRKQLAQVFTRARWSDVTPDWPTQEIVRYVPNPTFGGFSYFVDLLLNGDAQLLEKAPFTTLADDQATIPESIAGNVNAVGFTDYPFYLTNASALKLVQIEGTKPALEKTLNRAYPLVAPLLLYTDAATLQAKPQVAQFLIFYLTHLDEALAEAHEFPVNVERLDRTKIILAQAMGNSNYLNQISQQRRQAPTSTPLPAATPTAAARLQAPGNLTNTLPITNTPAK